MLAGGCALWCSASTSILRAGADVRRSNDSRRKKPIPHPSLPGLGQAVDSRVPHALPPEVLHFGRRGLLQGLRAPSASKSFCPPTMSMLSWLATIGCTSKHLHRDIVTPRLLHPGGSALRRRADRRPLQIQNGSAPLQHRAKLPSLGDKVVRSNSPRDVIILSAASMSSRISHEIEFSVLNRKCG